MKINPMNEKECREFNVPYFETSDELKEFIDSLDILNDDYGTAAYAMTLAAIAGFNYIAHKFGCTGFQASCADLDFLRRTRSLNGGFIILKDEDLLYPQNANLKGRLSEHLDDPDLREWLKEEANKLLIENPNAHPDVIAHWQKLVKG